MDKGFIEIIERLSKIETKLDDYKGIKEKAEQADNLSKQNAKEIEALKSNQKWVVFLVLGSVIGAILKIVIIG